MENQKKLIIGLIAIVVVGAGIYFVSASNLKGDFYNPSRAPAEEQKTLTQADSRVAGIEDKSLSLKCTREEIFSAAKYAGEKPGKGFKSKVPFQKLIDEIKNEGWKNCQYRMDFSTWNPEVEGGSQVAVAHDKTNTLFFYGKELSNYVDSQVLIEYVAFTNDPDKKFSGISLEKYTRSGNEMVSIMGKIWMNERNIFYFNNATNLGPLAMHDDDFQTGKARNGLLGFKVTRLDSDSSKNESPKSLVN